VTARFRARACVELFSTGVAYPKIFGLFFVSEEWFCQYVISSSLLTRLLCAFKEAKSAFRFAANHSTNRWSQPLAVVKSTFDL